MQDQGDGTYRCEKCNLSSQTFNWRLILKFAMADPTDNQWVNCFQDQGEQILGISAEDLGVMFQNDRQSYDKVFTKATFKRYNCRLRCKADFYNDDQRVQHTLTSATQLDYKDYCKKMIKDLEAAGMALPSEINREKYM